MSACHPAEVDCAVDYIRIRSARRGVALQTRPPPSALSSGEDRLLRFPTAFPYRRARIISIREIEISIALSFQMRLCLSSIAHLLVLVAVADVASGSYLTLFLTNGSSRASVDQSGTANRLKSNVKPAGVKKVRSSEIPPTNRLASLSYFEITDLSIPFSNYRSPPSTINPRSLLIFLRLLF